MKTEKREVEIVVISDAHLGTYGCHAKELHHYLKSVKPKMLVLNGDIIDVWQFNKSYFPKSHMKVVKDIVNIISSGTPVYYITGNHDDVLRRFTDFEMGSFKLVNKLVLEIDGKKQWIFHGDVFDLSMKYSRRLAIIGGKSYDYLILLNRFINRVLNFFGKEKISLSKTIKDSVKKAVKFVDDFEQTAANHAIAQQYDFVICGHIHRPQMREMSNEDGKVMYLNSGDWIENLTALEYNNGGWSLYEYNKDSLANEVENEDDNQVMADDKELLTNLAAEFNFMLAGKQLLAGNKNSD
jgi:UDP-2,3-diacylglucosamine pyrophosphatase LpxH